MKTVAEILKDHVTLEIECIDRIYLNGYIRNLQTPKALKAFFNYHRGNPVVSPALLNHMTKGFVKAVETYAEQNNIPIIQFEKNQRKDDVANAMRNKRQIRDGVVFIGVAQEKALAFKGRKVGPYDFDFSRQNVFVKHYYFYLDDEDFGPGFIKICTYAPYPVRVCLNGHEWAKCQLQHRQINYSSLDNGFLSCEQPDCLQEICTQLSTSNINAFFRKWVRRLPFPLTEQDRNAGYSHDLSIIQLEVSNTQVFERPVRGREFFENVIGENLDMGRPERVKLLFDRQIRKTTPGNFSTRVITSGVHPSIHIQYKKTDIKQYFKENRALRTETTIKDARDFGVGKRLRNLNHLRCIAASVNRRLLEVQRISQDCIISGDSVERLTQPTETEDGQRAPSFKLGDPRVVALFAALTLFSHTANGFRNRQLRIHVADLMGISPKDYSARKMGYDLKRLRLKGIVWRQPNSTRYWLTSYGVRVVTFITRLHSRVLRPGYAALNSNSQLDVPHKLQQKLDGVNKEIDALLEKAALMPSEKAA
jgi:hypothetical protein